MSLLEARGITVRFGGNLAVSDVDLTVEAGQIVGLIGPNGAGKTTTFNALTGMLTPTAGTVMLEGRNVTGWPTFRRAQEGLARTFQRLEVFTSLTVRENIRMAAELKSRDTAEHVDHILEQVGLTAIADDSASAISTGMARLWRLVGRWQPDPRCCCWTSLRRARTNPKRNGSVNSWRSWRRMAWPSSWWNMTCPW